VYDYAIGIAGGLAGVMLMIGGFQYLTAGGDASRVGAAKKRITDSMVGLVLVLGAFLILNTINPDLVNMSEIRVPMVQKQVFVACNRFLPKAKCGEPFSLTPIAGKNAENTPNILDRYEISTGDTCAGGSCKKAGLDDVNYKCAQTSSPPQGATLGQSSAVEPWGCYTCKKYGDPCTGNGASDECCTGFCANGVCRTGENGDDCDSNNQECKSGICQQAWSDKCSSGLNGMPCDADNECKDGHVCVKSSGLNVCLKPQVGGWCADNNDCPGGMTCVNDHCGGPSAECTPGKVGAGTDFCVAAYGQGAKCIDGTGTDYCGTGEPGAPCKEDSDCKRGPNGPGYCIDSIVETVTGAKGVCSDGSPGSRCDEGWQCNPGPFCFKIGRFGTCTAGEEWDGCMTNTDCNQGLYKCDTTNHRCIKK